MSLKRLDIHNVRNILAQTIKPSSTLNFIYGKNASGKSALLEAIHLFGRAKSFRTANIKSVINHDQSVLTVSGQIRRTREHVVQMGLQMDGKLVEIRKNQLTCPSRSELAYTFPLQIIHPTSFELLDAGSQIRREFMDWGIFNHEEKFLLAWKRYKKALAQRNALLKLRQTGQVQLWNQELATYGTIAHEYRKQYLAKLKPVLNTTVSRFLPYTLFHLNLVAGWDESKTLLDALNEDMERDLRDGFSHSGPHRGDFQIMLNDRLAKDVVSRGQLKLLVICLKLAQVALMHNEQDYFGCVLLDDFAAELDENNRAKVLQFLMEMKCQVFVTATEKQDFGDLSNILDYKMFHMEHGKVEEINVPRGTEKTQEAMNE